MNIYRKTLLIFIICQFFFTNSYSLDLSLVDLKYCGYPQKNKEIWYLNLKGNSNGEVKQTLYFMNGEVEESDLNIKNDEDNVYMDYVKTSESGEIRGVRYWILDPNKYKPKPGSNVYFDQAFFIEENGKKKRVLDNGAESSEYYPGKYAGSEGNLGVQCAKQNKVALIESEIKEITKNKKTQKKLKDYNESPEGLLHNTFLSYQIISVLFKSRKEYAIQYISNQQMEDAKKKAKKIQTILVKEHNLDPDAIWKQASNTYKEKHSHFDIVLSTGGFNDSIAGAGKIELISLDNYFKKVTGSTSSVEKDF